LRMILSENRFPLFGIMRHLAHDLIRKPVSIPDQVEDMLFGIMRRSGRLS